MTDEIPQSAQNRNRSAGNRQPDYGEDVAEIGSEYEFYSQPNSRANSIHTIAMPQSHSRGASASHLAHQERLNGARQVGSLPDMIDNHQQSASPSKMNSSQNMLNRALSHPRTGSEVTFGTKEEHNRFYKKQKAEIENAPMQYIVPTLDGFLDNDANAEQHVTVSKDHLPKVLYSPDVRSKLQALKSHKPWFLGVVSIIQVATLIISFILNNQVTGSIIQTTPFNVMIGPTSGVLIHMGARFVPCIRHSPLNVPGPQILCPAGISSTTTGFDPSTNTTQPTCTLQQICGFGYFNQPNQWYRFITPIFLHGGVVHLLFNLLFQVRTGFQMERDFGWWRIAAIYMISGIGGFIFGGNYNGYTPSVGCSGALYGLLACLLIDMFQNWKIIMKPHWELLKLGITILISFMIGMLPYVDNFAHLGGFFCGILSGIIFMPTIHYSKVDGRIKTIIQIAAIPTLIVVYVFLIKGFYDNANPCPWCKYLNCIPGMPWCDSKWSQILTLSNE